MKTNNTSHLIGHAARYMSGLALALVLAPRALAESNVSTDDSLLVATPSVFERAVAVKGKAARVARMAVRTEQLHRGTLRLNLPGGRVLSVIRDSLQQTAAGDVIWKGRIAGEPLSRATFVMHEGVVSGVVDRALEQGNELYEITPSPAGGYIVTRTDDTEALACGHERVPAVQVAPPAPSKNSRKLGSNRLNPVVREAAGNVQIDIMVVYTPASRVRYGKAGIEAKILQAVADANTGFVNSQIGATYNLVHMGEVAYTETGDMYAALGSIAGTTDGVLDEIHALRDSVGADLVSMIDEDTNYGGISYAMTYIGTSFAPYAFSVVGSTALAQLSLSHEMAHNMGCQHDRSNSGYQTVAPYAYGWRKCVTDGTGFRTVMSYSCSGVPRINYFSNPQLSYLGSPLGVDYAVDTANAADNARALRETMATVADFRATVLPPAPTTPSGVTAAAGSPTTATITWVDNASNESAQTVERSTDGVSYSVVATLPANVTAYSDSNLTPATAYWYRIAASNAGGSSACSVPATVNTPAIPTPPAAPSGLVASGTSSSQVGLSWVDNATDETSYLVECSANGTTFTQVATLGGGTVSYNCTGLKSATTYWFRVRATNNGGSSAYSATACATTLASAPAAPSRLSLTASSQTQINLSWTDNASNETGFRIERSLNGTTFTEVAVLGANVKTYSSTGLTANTVYYFRVRAYNAGGCSAYTSITSIRTKR